MPARFKDMVIDAENHQALAAWYCRAFGYRLRDELDPPLDDDGSLWTRPSQWPVPLADPEGRAPVIWVQAVPERKVAKNRLHLDFFGDTEELLALGATVVARQNGEDQMVDWDVLADPEGNEFCVFTPRD